MDPRLDVIEAGYRLDLCDDLHRTLVLQTLSGKFAARGPMAMWSVYHGTPKNGPPFDVRFHDDEGSVLSHALFNVALPDVDRHYFAAVGAAFLTVSELSREFGAHSRALGVGDLHGLVCPGDHGRITMVGAMLSDTTRRNPAFHRYWHPVARHLSEAFRLRGRLQRESKPNAQAVLTPNGKVLDAAAGTSLRELNALRKAVLVRERGRARNAKATSLWTDLTKGRIAIVDRFDSAGRRLVVVHRHEPIAGSPRALDEREARALALLAAGSANKVVAIELGVSEPTASRIVARTLRKVGLNLAEVVAAARETQVWSMLRGAEPLQVVELSVPHVQALASLTQAEREIIAEVLDGKTDREIAAQRGRSRRTVEAQTKSGFEKLGVRSRRELVFKLCQPLIGRMPPRS